MVCILALFSPLVWGVSCSDPNGEDAKGAFWTIEGDVDEAVRPGNDFYQHAVGAWLAAHPLSGAADINGTIADSERKSEAFLSNIIANGSGDIAIDKIASEIKTAEIDWDTQVRVPAERLIDQINAARTKDELVPVFARMVRGGFSPVMSVTFTPVARETEILLQPGRIETRYREDLSEDYYILAALDTNTGVDRRISERITAANVLPRARQFVASLKTGVGANSAATDRKISSRLSPNNYAHTVLLAAGFSEAHIARMQYGSALDTYFKNLDGCDLDGLKAYLTLIVYDEMYRFSRNISVVGDDAVYENFEYAFKKRPFAQYNLAKSAAETNVSPEAKAKIVSLLEEIRAAFIERTADNDWMSEATKAKAREKAKNTQFFVAYPESYNMDFVLGDFEQTNCFDDVHSLEEKTFSAHLKNLDNTSEGTMWALFPTVGDTLQFNAFNHRVNNWIIINPFASCPPACELGKGDAYMYGTLAFILGHEFTHGFDAIGSNYDKNGAAAHWWTAEDREEFRKKQQQAVKLFSSYDIFSGLISKTGEMNDGEATLVENMADMGGLALAHSAYMAKKEKELDAEQLAQAEKDFYLAAAQCYKGNQSDTYKIRAKLNDTHSNFKIRINGTVVNMPSWYTAFDVQPGDVLYKAPDERIVLW